MTQADGNQVAQLLLFDDGSGAVNATVVRTLELPTPSGDPADSQELPDWLFKKTNKPLLPTKLSLNCEAV